MAWTAPRTWVTGETVTAALMNAHIRDNFLETATATALAQGDIIFADAANSMGSRVGISDSGRFLVSTGTAPVWREVTTDGDTGTNTTTSTTYVDLATVGFATNIETTVTVDDKAFIFLKAQLSNDTTGQRTSLAYSISGATTAAATDNRALRYESSAAGDLAEFGGFDLRTGLTAGSNTFTLEARVDAGTGTIVRPDIAVMAF